MDADFAPPAVGVDPGATSLVRARVRANTRQWQRRSRTLSFRLEAEQQGTTSAIADGTLVPRAAWFYPDPLPGFEAIRDAVAFYPALMDECTLDGEVVVAQPGDFYGGWISSEVAGPFKGGPGTRGIVGPSAHHSGGSSGGKGPSA